MPVHWPPRSIEASPPPGVVGKAERGLETRGVSRALEKADRYGDMDELSAVLEKGESGPPNLQSRCAHHCLTTATAAPLLPPPGSEYSPSFQHRSAAASSGLWFPIFRSVAVLVSSL